MFLVATEDLLRGLFADLAREVHRLPVHADFVDLLLGAVRELHHLAADHQALIADLGARRADLDARARDAVHRHEAEHPDEPLPVLAPLGCILAAP